MQADREDDCMPPYACGPFYAGYVPVYYVAHPYSLYFSPYAAMYNYSFYHGVLTPARATTRPFTPNNTRAAASKSPVYSSSVAAKANPPAKTGTSGSNSGSKPGTTNIKPAAPAPPRVSTSRK